MTLKWQILKVGLATIMLAGCATPSDRIASELTRYGLSPGQATCVGERLETRLSIGQLKQLAGAARAYGRDDSNPGQLTVSDLARVSAQISDPRIPVEVATAGANCGILGRVLFR